MTLPQPKLPAAACGAVVGGGLLGVVDRVLSLGPHWTLVLANVGAIWLAAAFAAGLFARRLLHGALLGLLALLAMWSGYYGYMHFAEGQANAHYLLHIASVWLVASVGCGIAFGALGALARSGAWWPPLLLAATAAAEALIAVPLGNGDVDPVHVAELIVAAGAAALLVSRHGKLRPTNPR